MFYFPIYNLLTPNIFDLTTDNGKQMNIPRQLAFHFLKRDEATGATREADINDDIQIVKGDRNDLKWQYLNLRDILFYMNIRPSTTISIWSDKPSDGNPAVYFTRRKNTMYCYPYKHYNYGYKTASKHFVHIEHNGNDYILPSVRVNWNDFSFVDLWALGTEKDLLYTKVKALCEKHGITTIPNCNAIYKIKGNKYIIGEWANGYYMNTPAFLVDGITPFKDSFLSDYTEMYNLLIDSGTTNTATGLNSEGYGRVSNIIIDLPFVHDDYYPFDYDKVKYLGTDTSGKVKIWNNSYTSTLPKRPYILDPVHTLGLIVCTDVWTSASSKGGQKHNHISNMYLNSVIPKITGGGGITIVILNDNREVKDRWNYVARFNQDPSTMKDGIYTMIEPGVICSIDEQNRFSALIDGNYTLKFSKLLSKGEIYRTPKNKDFDYFTITANDIKTLYDDEDYINIVTVDTMVILQKGYTGKSMVENIDEYIALKNTSTDVFGNMTAHNFRDANILKLYEKLFESPTSTSHTFPANITKPTNVDNVLVDGAFDHFNEIFEKAPVYIVDTNILKTFGLGGDKYHQYMPDRSIWFEVDDLYTYTTDGKISDFNAKYVNLTSGNYEFIYDLQQFTKFKAKYLQTVKEVLWDTRIANNTDFFYMDENFENTQHTGTAYLSSCSDPDEYFSIIWQPLSHAIFNLYGICLDTAAEPEQEGVLNA